MTYEQERAATQLLRAFNRCRDVGLSAGVFDSNVCVWPKEIDVQGSADALAAIDEHGRSFSVEGMWLDGGAGV